MYERSKRNQRIMYVIRLIVGLLISFALGIVFLKIAKKHDQKN